MKFDSEQALEAAGSWGLFQKLLIVQCFFYAIPNAFSFIHFAVSHYEPTHHCRLPEKYYNFSTKVSVVRPQTIDIKLSSPFFRMRRCDQKCSTLSFRARRIDEAISSRRNAPCTKETTPSTQLKTGRECFRLLTTQIFPRARTE